MAREVRPEVGDTVKYIHWPDYDEPKEGIVTQLLSSQFVLLSSKGESHYKFYKDHGSEWRVVKPVEQAR